VRRVLDQYKDFTMANQSTMISNNTYVEGEVANPPILPEIVVQKSIADPDT
jgi:hypothetical protein